MIGLIWAQAANGVIGRDNAIPWRLPEDLAHFRELTTGTTVIMGRRTWDSLPPRFRPLPGRRNIVLTHDPDWTAVGASAASSLDDGLAAAALPGDVWIIGGGRVYAQALLRAEVVEVTELAETFDGDTYAPRLDNSWPPPQIHPADGWLRSSTGLHYRFVRYTRT